MRMLAGWLALGGLTAIAVQSANANTPAPGSAANTNRLAVIQEETPKPEPAVVLLRAKEVITRPGVSLKDTAILIEDGKIMAVGPDLELPEGATLVEGAVVCAGFIDPWSALGVEAGVLANSNASPSTRTADGLNLEAVDHLLLEAQRAGVTAVRLQAAPEGMVGGLGSVVRTAVGFDLERSILLDDANLAMSAGLTQNRGFMGRSQAPDPSHLQVPASRRTLLALRSHSREPLSDDGYSFAEGDPFTRRDFRPSYPSPAAK